MPSPEDLESDYKVTFCQSLFNFKSVGTNTLQRVTLCLDNNNNSTHLVNTYCSAKSSPCIDLCIQSPCCLTILQTVPVNFTHRYR